MHLFDDKAAYGQYHYLRMGRPSTFRYIERESFADPALVLRCSHINGSESCCYFQSQRNISATRFSKRKRKCRLLKAREDSKATANHGT